MSSVEIPQVVQSSDASPTLHRSINWSGAFWVASGVPALVLFSIGQVAGAVGKLSFVVWSVSILMGFIQSFTYAEIAGLFPNKSGGASIYGAAAWVRYSKTIAPLSVWCNWLAWSPVLSLGCTIAAAYILTALSPIHDFTAWTLFSHTFGPVTISLNAAFFVGAALMLITFAIQHRGIGSTANIQKYLGLLVIVPLIVVGVVPLLNGHVHYANFMRLVPPAANGAAEPGHWNLGGWTLVLGGMFLAAWSTYAFETAICYTSEFRNPGKDTSKAIFYSGLLCIGLFVLVPFTFQGVLGVSGMLAAPINDGSGVAAALAGMVGGGRATEALLVAMMILALLLSIMMAMAGSSRTLYQGSVDGWLPRYLGQVNSHGAPTRAMWTDLVFNLAVLSIACGGGPSFVFILTLSNCCYMIFNFLNLNAGWIHRIDSGDIARPYRAPTWLLALGAIFAFVNAAFMGAGAKVWNPWTLGVGALTAALILPVFWFRHYVQDKGQFPRQMLQDLQVGGRSLDQTRAGLLPYFTLAAGIAVVLLANYFFKL
ncbi:MAG: APC family permease [Steroidobacteraceae bacterium]